MTGQTKPAGTRQRILDTAQEAILAKGFDATSIEEIVAAVNISKGGFFYHFPDKNALARALLERYIDEENALFDGLFDRARELNDDPLHVMLIALKLLAELVENLPEGHPGCLVATACYQERLFDRDVFALNRRAMLEWRAKFKAQFDAIAALYPPRDPVDLDDLSDMASGVLEGGIVLSKALGDDKALAKQVMLFRSYVKLLFSPRLQ